MLWCKMSVKIVIAYNGLKLSYCIILYHLSLIENITSRFTIATIFVVFPLDFVLISLDSSFPIMWISYDFSGA